MPPSSERARRFLFLGDKNEVNLNGLSKKSEGVVFLYIYPLSSETVVPSVSPLYFPTETQGRRLNCYYALLLSGKTR